MRLTTVSLLALLVAGAVACGDDTTTEGSGGNGTGTGGSDGTGGDTSSPTSVTTTTGATTASSSSSSSAGGEGGGATTGSGGGGGAPVGCREPAPADRDRFAVVGHFFAEPPNDYEVLRLTEGGVLETTGVHFAMGESTDSRIVFTPDGRIGVSVQERGTLGIFSIDDDGNVTVVDEGFGGGDVFFGSAVTMAADGSHVMVADGNTYANGGGLYRVDLDCETGEPTLVGLEVEVNNAWAVLDLGDDRWVVGSNGGVLGEVDGTDVHDLREGDPWVLADAVETSEGGAVFSEIVASSDGSFLIALNSSLSSPDEASLMTIDGDGLTLVEEIPAEGPLDVAIAPGGEVAIITLLEEGIMVYDIAAGGASFELRGELPYLGSNSALPAKLAQVQRGALEGLTLVAELDGVRVVAFEGGGDVVDLGLTALSENDEDIAAIPTGIGIQP